MAQVSNVQSRTLRVLGNLSDSVKDSLNKLSGVVLLEKESKSGSKKTFVTAENVSAVIDQLSKNNVTFRPHFYSLFAKFNVELKTSEVSKLNSKVLEIVPGAGVSYSRVDENGHTGKVVVDRFEDYNTLRSYEGDFTFYKFNRNKAQVRSTQKSSTQRPTQQTSTENDEGFTRVSRSRKVETKPTTTDKKPVRTAARTTRGTGKTTTSATKTVSK
jgi:hypothetical protein